MIKEIKAKIRELRSNTLLNLALIQKETVPVHSNSIQLHQQWLYTFEGYDVPIRNKGEMVLRAVNLPFIYTHKYRGVYMDTLSNLVTNKIMYPFMLFINDKFIKWSDINIINDYDSTYILLRNMNTDIPSQKIDVIILPCTVRYGENSNILNGNGRSFYFNASGNLIDSSVPANIAARVEIIDSDIVGGTYKITESKRWFKVSVSEKDFNKHSFIGNILVYADGVISDDEKLNITSIGYNLYRYDGDLTNKSIEVKAFLNTNSNISKNMMYKIPNHTEVESDLVEYLDTGIGKSYLTNIDDPFSFVFNKELGTDANFTAALEYIGLYDPTLLNGIIKDNSKVKSVVYTGQQILNLRDTNGFITMMRHVVNGFDDFVIMFHNNKIYEYYCEIKYDTNKFKIPIFDKIAPDDKVEFLFFQGVNNESAEITITETGTNHVSGIFDIKKAVLFANTAENIEYALYDQFGTVQYDVNATYDIVDGDSNEYKITLTNPYYYGKKLNLAQTNQFRYCYKNCLAATTSIVLNHTFKFCHDINHYMVFVNGERIPNSLLSLTIADPAIPFDDLSLYINMVVDEGGKIEVFYLPNDFIDIVQETQIDTNGNIEISMDILPYPLSKELYMIFINGRKIHPDNIVDVSKNKIQIVSDIGSIKNLCITQYIVEEFDEDITEIFNQSDTWTTFINSLSVDDYKRLIGTTQLTDGADFTDVIINNTATLFEIAKDYYNKEITNDGSNTVYAFDDTLIAERDVDIVGNYIVHTTDTTNTQKADIYGTDGTATTSVPYNG